MTIDALYRRHILPHLMGPLIIQCSLNLAGIILLEAALSFLGMGVQPHLSSLGQMLGEGRDYMLFASWTALVPGVVILLIILSISGLAGWLRDALDPHTRSILTSAPSNPLRSLNQGMANRKCRCFDTVMNA